MNWHIMGKAVFCSAMVCSAAVFVVVLIEIYSTARKYLNYKLSQYISDATGPPIEDMSAAENVVTAVTDMNYSSTQSQATVNAFAVLDEIRRRAAMEPEFVERIQEDIELRMRTEEDLPLKLEPLDTLLADWNEREDMFQKNMVRLLEERSSLQIGSSSLRYLVLHFRLAPALQHSRESVFQKLGEVAKRSQYLYKQLSTRGTQQIIP